MITSRRNPLVKRLRELHVGKGRREQGLLLAEGTHLLQEARRLDLLPVELLATQAWADKHPELWEGWPDQVRRYCVDGLVLAAVATTAQADGVVFSLAPPAAPSEPPPARQTPPASQPSFVLVLDGLQDPGNLGTLMRTALAAGVEALWLAEGADPFQPKVLRSSAGAALALPIERIGRPQLEERLRAAAGRGMQLAAAVPPGLSQADGKGPLAYWQLDWLRPTALLLGNEGAGLAAELQAIATHLITIPHCQAVESLNVAVSAAPLLLERLRQRSGT
ncbi:RNA methyltransferase [Cyanobium sp. WAJ14-Wanaka]|nr:RNA methyltransferase [Cyanobium sp. WAJ14-Wanaka]